MKPKNLSGGHLTRTQKAAGPSEESMRNHPAWIVKCKFIRILELVGGLYSTYFQFMGFIPPINNNGSHQYGADGFKHWGSKTIGGSIQSFFEISG